MSDAPPERRKRRPRYRGSNPRAFDDKYKELDPERYADEVAKVVASGKTPAGMHRPIMVQEVLEILAPKPGDFAVDATLGYGGHTAALLEAVLPGGTVLALDVDPIELPKTEARFRAMDIPPDALMIRRSNFAGLAGVLAGDNLPAADVVLADLGVSSMQTRRSLTRVHVQTPGPLDLRMNPQRGRPAAGCSRRSMRPGWRACWKPTRINPTPKRWRRPSSSASDARPSRPRRLSPRRWRARAGPGPSDRSTNDVVDSIRRVFQALRIAVNDELGALDTFLRLLPGCVISGGRVAIVTFHSGEDRRVKQAFKEGVRSGAFARVAEEVVRPGADERRANPRSSAAKLRWAIRA